MAEIKLSETQSQQYEPASPEEYGSPHKEFEAPPSAPKTRKKRGVVWLVFLVIIVGLTGYALWHAGESAATSARGRAAGNSAAGARGGRGGGLGPAPVVVTKIGRSSIPVYLNELGNVAPYFTVTVKSRVDGQLMKVDFNEGDLVKQDQTLIEIDPRPYQVQLDQYEGQLIRDQAILDNAKVDLARYQGLLKLNAIQEQQVATQEALVKQTEGAVKTDQGLIESAKLNLVYCNITAPISGVVGLRLVDPGNIVHASDATGMITITQLQPISVLFTIPEDDLPAVTQKLRAGVQLPVEAYNRDNSVKLGTGKLVTLDNQIDSTTGTSKLKAVFDNKGNTLFPQQFVNIRLLVETLNNRLVVPNVAIQNGQQGTFLYVVDSDSKVHLKPVQVGTTTATQSDILSGISEGDRVVVDGIDRLIEGAMVRVRKPGELDNPPDYDAGGRGRGGNGSKKGEGKSKGDNSGKGRNGGGAE
jgi:multidrug efflux system membrane fusion protein